MAAVSAMELLSARHAYRERLLRAGAPPGTWEATRLGSLFPVCVFFLSIPIAFVNPTLALLSWFALAPVGALINRRMPPDVRAYFGRY